jgi:APA family basic amino acid/polyamine antiporter
MEEETADHMNSKKATPLKRTMRLPHATAMVVGIIIGASIFVQPSEITGRVPSIGGVFLVWIVSGILSLLGALVCAELAKIFTKSGGVYLYLKESFSPSVGFLWGWAMFWSIHSGIIAAISIIFARYVGYFFPHDLNDTSIKCVAILVIVILSIINYAGVKQGSSLQTIITIGKIIVIVSIIIAGFVLGSNTTEHFVQDGTQAQNFTIHNYFLALVAGLFAFGGWHMVTYSSEETVTPKKTIPRALILGMTIVTVCYIALNAVYLYILPLETVTSSTRIVADAANALVGSGGGAFMSGLVIFSTFGALNGIILSGPRVYYAMARDRLLFQWAGKIHPRYGTPSRAIILQAVWSSVLVITGSYRILFTRVVYTEWIFFALMAAGLILLKQKTKAQQGSRIWMHFIIPSIFILSSLAIITNQIIESPEESFFGFALVLSGLPVFFIWTHKTRKGGDHK